MTVIATLFGLIYLCAALMLAVYALHAYGILGVLFRHTPKANRTRRECFVKGDQILQGRKNWPEVVTQIPLYNEANVATRIMRAAARMEYPGRHAIQVLDDSDDETRETVDRVAMELRREGKNVEVLRRPNRQGFKAGALAYGMEGCRAPFLAVFDADFVPEPDFLMRTVPFFFGDPVTGFVQGRWTFLNEADSLLTRAQGMGLDSHFAIEQDARSSHPAFFMNFNGTAGVWRRAAIESAGGWSAETLTEDLDLSYRVQLAGWRGVFLNDLPVPGELPARFSGFKSQQFRWAKGSMQTAVKLFPTLWCSNLPVTAKAEAFFHLTHYAVHPLLFLVVLLAPVAVMGGGPVGLPGLAGALLLLAAFAPSVFYGIGQVRLHSDWPRRLLRLPALTLAGMGLAAGNARAIGEALLGRRSAFIRTPKRGDHETRRYRVRFPIPPLWEVVLGGYALCGALFSWQAGYWGMAQFGVLAAASFLFMGGGSLWEEYRAARPLASPRSGFDTRSYRSSASSRVT